MIGEYCCLSLVLALIGRIEQIFHQFVSGCITHQFTHHRRAQTAEPTCDLSPVKLLTQSTCLISWIPSDPMCRSFPVNLQKWPMPMPAAAATETLRAMTSKATSAGSTLRTALEIQMLA
jgi:hypothetical protein